MHIKSYAASRAVDVEQKKGNETEQQGKILKFDSFLAIFNHSFLCSVGGCNRPPPSGAGPETEISGEWAKNNQARAILRSNLNNLKNHIIR